MSSASSHWRRFVGSCSTPPSIHNQPGNGYLLSKSPSEWQRYSVLMRSCPAARMALLDYLTPVFVDYFVMWWQRHTRSDRPARAIDDASNEMLEDLYTAETTLCDLIHLLRELVTSPNASEQFVSTVCSWCLGRLRPICMVPPTQLLAQLRRLLQSAATAARSRSVPTAANTTNAARAGRLDSATGLVRRGRTTKPMLDALSRVREGSPFSDASGAAAAASSDSELTSDTETENDDDEDGGDEDVLAATSILTVPTVNEASVTDIKLLLDLNPDSSGNKQLLGSWSRCPLLMEMLHLTYELLLGSCASLSTVQALLSGATIPVPPELSSVAGYHPPPTAVLPHWVITWLTYQSYRIIYAGTTIAHSPISRLVRSVLDAATKPPPHVPNILSSSNTPDTLAGWYGEQRIDVSFWISSCLTHLLFLGDETPALVYNWLVEKLDSLFSSELGSDSVPCFSGFLHVLLRIGLSTVPIPPSLPSGLEPSGGSAVTPTTNPPGPTTTAVFIPPAATTAAAAAGSDRPVRFPGAMYYTTGFGCRPSDHLGVNPTGAMHPSGAPYYLQTFRRPAAAGGAGSFPLPNPPPLALFNVTQPPGPNAHPMPTSCATGPPPPFCSNITRPPPDAPARPSMHHARRHIRSVDEPATEWTMCTPTRRPASLMWLLNLARLLRVAAITALDRSLSRLTTAQFEISLPGVLARLFPDGVDRLGPSSQSSFLFQLATEMLLTAPAIAGHKNLIVFLFDAVVERNPGGSDQANSESNSSADILPSFRTICARLLQSAAMMCLNMVHSSTELADSLNRGGCEGLLSTVQQLAVPYSLDLSTTNPQAHSGNTVSSSSSLFHLLIGPHPHVALIAAHLLVALSLTVEPNLPQHILIHLCCSLKATRLITGNPSPQYTPLLLFFPILDELEIGWTARRSQCTDTHASIPWISSELVPHTTNDPFSYRPTGSGAYLVHELLSDRFLPRLWDLVSNRSLPRDEACSMLQALIWLVRREDALFRSRLARPRLQLALRAQLKPLLTLMNSQLYCVELTDLLITLLEFAIVNHENGITGTQNSPSSNVSHGKETAKPGSGTRTIAFAAYSGVVRSECLGLPPSVALRAGRQLVCVAAKLLRKMRNRDSKPVEVVHVARQLERIEQALLLIQFNPDSGLSLVRSTAIRCMVETDNIRLFYPSYQSEVDSVNFSGRIWLRDVDEQLVDIRSLPNSLNEDQPLTGAFSGSALLLFNPTPFASPTDDDDLTRGYLRAPNSSRSIRGRTTDSCKRPPGTAFNASAVDSVCPTNFRSSEESHKSWPSSASSPHWLHWLRLTNRLVSNRSGSVYVVLAHDRSRANGLHWLAAAALQQTLLPHGMHLPQTSVWQLPEQIPLVLPPHGIGLERAIRLMHQFCPEVKAQAIGQFGPFFGETRDPVWLIQSLFQAPLEVERSLLMDHTDYAGINLAKMDPFYLSDWTQRPPVHFPYPRLLLGLLMGLEAAWASPLAPRISISDAMTYLSSHEGAYAQGVFPVLGAPELHSFYARKLAVDYAQRRVDCRTDLFRFTKQLLMILFAIFHEHDRITVASTDSTEGPTVDAEARSKSHVHLPLDRLLYCLTPRELSTLLSDVRRNLRLRWAFSWLQDYQKGGYRLQSPLSIVASKTLDLLGGSVPPAPGFITPGLLLALLQSHLTEPGVADLVGPLLKAVRWLQPPTVTEAMADTADTDSVVEEIDVNGELMVVLND